MGGQAVAEIGLNTSRQKYLERPSEATRANTRIYRKGEEKIYRKETYQPVQDATAGEQHGGNAALRAFTMVDKIVLS